MNTQTQTMIAERGDSRNLQDLGTVVNSLIHDDKIKHDLVAPSGAMHMLGGQLMLDGLQIAGSRHFHNGIASKLNMPQKYAERMLNEAVELYDTNANHWLNTVGKKYFVRTLKTDAFGGNAFGRAFLSDSYQVIDNLDIVTIVLDMVKKAKIECEVTRCDVSATKFYMRLTFPGLIQRSSILLKNYRTPKGEGDEDRVAMSLVISNSEVGNGKMYITPQVKMLVCSNGMTREQDIIGRTHLGSKMDEGVVKSSQRTKHLNQQLIVSQMQDAIKQFLTIDYLEGRIKELEAKLVDVENPMEAVEYVSSRFDISDAERLNIMNSFIKGGLNNNFGIAQAITWEAQQVESADRHYELESIGGKVMDLNFN